MKTPKLFVAVLVSSCSLPLIGQSRHASVAAACGDLHVSMVVQRKSQHRVQQIEPGKALIYFIQDAGQEVKLGMPTTRIGIDGRWVGAINRASYFSVSIAPGEHHLCAAVQSMDPYIELAHLTTDAGKVYYFRTRAFPLDRPVGYFSLVPVDSDEAQYLVAQYPLATAHTRK